MAQLIILENNNTTNLVSSQFWRVVKKVSLR